MTVEWVRTDLEKLVDTINRMVTDTLNERDIRLRKHDELLEKIDTRLTALEARLDCFHPKLANDNRDQLETVIAGIECNQTDQYSAWDDMSKRLTALEAQAAPAPVFAGDRIENCGSDGDTADSAIAALRAAGLMEAKAVTPEVELPCTETCGWDELGDCDGEPTCPDYRPGTKEASR